MKENTINLIKYAVKINKVEVYILTQKQRKIGKGVDAFSVGDVDHTFSFYEN